MIEKITEKVIDKKIKKKSEDKKELKIKDDKKYSNNLDIFDYIENIWKSFKIKSTLSQEDFEESWKIAKEICFLKTGLNLESIHQDYYMIPEIVKMYKLESKSEKQGIERIPGIKIVVEMLLLCVRIFGDSRFFYEIVEESNKDNII